jgi:hypothetical protein
MWKKSIWAKKKVRCGIEIKKSSVFHLFVPSNLNSAPVENAHLLIPETLKIRVKTVYRKYHNERDALVRMDSVQTRKSRAGGC